MATSNMETLWTHPLGKFLEKHKATERSVEATMVGMGHELKGRWRIPDANYGEFFDHLHDYLIVKKHRCLNLVEQPRGGDKPKPLLLDLDFKYSADSSLTRRFTDQHVSEFIGCVVEGLRTFFDVSVYESLRFFVSLRPQPYDDNKRIKDGIHIQCPDIALTNEKQKVLRAWLLDKKSVRDSFEGTGYINADEDVYDESMVRKQGWFFYGESKPKIPAYSLTNVYTYTSDTNTIIEGNVEEFTARELMELLSVRYGIQEDDNLVREEQKEVFMRYLNPPVPVRGGGGVPSRSSSPLRPVAGGTATGGAVGEDASGAVARPSTQELGVYIPSEHDPEELNLAREIALRCLSTDRANAYKEWMEVGWCLANISNTDAMFDTWMEFSKRSPKFSSNNVSDLHRAWQRGFSRNTAGSRLTLRSLHFWAREDNPEEYARIIENDIIRYIQYKVEDTHYHTAKMLKRIYNGRYCASVEQRRTEWYTYDPSLHSWRHTNQGMELREKLSSEIASQIVVARERLKKKGWDEYCKQQTGGAGVPVIDSDWYKNWAMTTDGERFQNLVKLEKHLFSCDFKSSVMKEAAELFCEEDFLNKLNMNQFLFGCRNGVLDLRVDTVDPRTGAKGVACVFRPGKPDDWISHLAGRNFPETEALEYHPYDPRDVRQRELADFLAKLFPRADLRAYVLRLLASCLEGMNREQCYYTFIGVGGNGKSKLVELMRLTFGDYISSLQATALTRKRPESGAANPDIVAIKNKRFIYLQEPDDKEPLNTSRMKQFSGEDIVEARGLFEDQQRFRITGKLCMMCNRLPPITSMDKGTWRRIRVIPFESKFVDPSDPDLLAGRPGFFPRDNDLDKKLIEWREPFLALLVHIYESEYCKNGLEPVPAIVMSESEKYKENFDAFGKFKSERIRKEAGQNTEFAVINRIYNQWMKEMSESMSGKRLTSNELKVRLEEEFGAPEGGKRFRHCLVFSSDEDVEAYDRGEFMGA